jgi:hypothetical protein
MVTINKKIGFTIEPNNDTLVIKCFHFILHQMQQDTKARKSKFIEKFQSIPKNF